MLLCHTCVLRPWYSGEQWVTDPVKPVFPPGTGSKVTVYVVRVVPRRLYSSADHLSLQVFSAVLPQNGVHILSAGLPMKAASPVLYLPDHAEHLPCTIVLFLET